MLISVSHFFALQVQAACQVAYSEHNFDQNDTETRGCQKSNPFLEVIHTQQTLVEWQLKR